MLNCPYCHQQIEDDSRYCDQCGKVLYYCPECMKPKRGTECPVCGESLVKADIYFASRLAPQIPPEPAPSLDREPIRAFEPVPQSTERPISNLPSGLAGNGWNLPLREGAFGRTGGIYPEFASCQYISGHHGDFSYQDGRWLISDFGSMNGTKVNGKDLIPGQSVEIHLGDRIRIATLNFVVI